MESYPYTIQTIHTKHPVLPAVLAGIDLNREVVAHAPLDRSNARHARGVAIALQGLHKLGDNHNVTEEVIEDAEYRATTLESLHAQAAFGPQNANQALEQILQRLQDLTAEVRLGRAETYNNAIISRNGSIKGDMHYLPLKKTIAGSGLPLAQAAYPLVNAPDLNGPPAEIGQIPPDFHSVPEGYTHQQICRLIVFYNHNFNIIPTDNLPERRVKLRRFLTEF